MAEPHQPARAEHAAEPQSPAGPDPRLLLVPPRVSAGKLERELDEWAGQEQVYLRRGWRLRRVADLEVEVLFLAPVVVDPASPLTVVAPCVRLRFDNYDLWAPSVEFVDPLSGAPVHPGVNAILPSADGPRNVLVHPHPLTGRPFLCLPGVREYHSHPQHTGDDWLLHRDKDAGRLAVVCERIWRAIPRTLIGIETHSRWMPPVTELRLQLLQGDPDQLRAMAARAGAPPDADAPGPAGEGSRPADAQTDGAAVTGPPR